jgi:phosphatidylserine/phosphatidylglycerophosphate/cardiolipin synthase-like enzyme
MRFKSAKTHGYQIFAVSGVNTVSFAVAADEADTSGLLGFAVERHDPTENERYYMAGFKVFESVIPHPDKNVSVSTFEHPIQSFVWDDFTAKPDRIYEYFFHPIKGQPKNLDHSAPPVRIKVRTEPLFSHNEHDVFFNRGVASSQAYARRFENKSPDDLDPAKRLEALQWLSRDLDEAILRFIHQAHRGDTLLGCFYEFHYRPVVAALKAALDRGADVRLIIDAKVNEYTDSRDHFHESFPRKINLETIAQVGIPSEKVILRQAKPSDLQHNKFMVLLKGANQQAKEVWTGSTNISEGGIFGQTNVGHWVRNVDVAAKFKSYWDLLSGDPGSKEGDDRSAARRANDAFKDAVEAIADVPQSVTAVSPGITAVFSPRSGNKVLEMYGQMLDGAQDLACVTLAFGINKLFKTLLQDNTAQSQLCFLLLEKEDAPRSDSTAPFITINASNNVYKAWGSFLDEPLYQWVKETNTFRMKINTHVAYIHSKFLLMDPLGEDPIVVTGSANFSDASTNSNDENMVIIRGNPRVADIYFTEFNRLFNHYYFRSVWESLHRQPANTNDDASLFLNETDEWLQKYQPGTLRFKRVQVFKHMKGFTEP